jgi:RNase P subunit RPR2
MDKNSIIRLKKPLKSHSLSSNDVGIIKEISPYEARLFFIGLNLTISLNQSELLEIDASKYGDAHKEKICNVCHKIFPTTEFDLNQNGKNNRPVRRPSCKNCRKTIDGLPIPTAHKKKWNALKPNLTEFKCPICKKITIPGLTSKVVLNHDHTTGIPTGWICDSCNTGLGRFKDDIQVLEEAINYLKQINRS